MNELTFDHPSEDLHGFIRIGRKEIVTYTTEGDGEWGGRKGEGVRCRSYQLTRIQCWKVGYMVKRIEDESDIICHSVSQISPSRATE